MRIWIGIGLSALAAACAQGSSGGDGDDVVSPDASTGVDAEPPDAEPDPDATIDAAPPDAMIDAAPPDAPPIDAMIDAPPPDAPPPDAMPIDAMPIDANCTTQTQQFLGNATFDLPGPAPWVQTPFDPQYPLITGDIPGAGPHTTPNGVWMGGFLSATDSMYQDVAIPAGATGVTLNGYRWIATEETGTIAYDTVTIDVRNTGGGLLETLATWSNVNASPGWTPFSLGLTGSYAGQTIRIHLRSQTDFLYNTNFFFDTFGLSAQVLVCP